VEYTDDDEKLSVENKDVSIQFDETRIRESLGKGEIEEAEEQVTKLRAKHGAEASADADKMEEQVTKVREGGRSEQEETTIVHDDDDRL
jgi:hypothetical protein